jgi:hypothetical protein
MQLKQGAATRTRGTAQPGEGGRDRDCNMAGMAGMMKIIRIVPISGPL